MFVRWRRKRRKDQRTGEYAPFGNHGGRVPVYAPDWLHSASLVESVRIDGKPRQRTIGYLGSIRERFLDPASPHHNAHCVYFWRKVDAALDALALPDADRVRVVASLEDVVPRPDLDQHRKDQEEARARVAFLAAELGLKVPSP